MVRKSCNKNFKARAALEALRGKCTLQELGRKYEVHPNQLAQWKKQLLGGAAELFEKPNQKSAKEREYEEREETLLKKVGQMSLEVDFLKEKLPADVQERRAMLDNRDILPLTRQCSLLGVSRSSFYYKSQVVKDENLK